MYPSPSPLVFLPSSSSHELSQVRASLDVLQDALAAPAGSADPGLFSELASQAREQQKQLSAALNAATDEHFLVQVCAWVSLSADVCGCGLGPCVACLVTMCC